MASHSFSAPRRVPSQQRGERRVAALLEAAAAEVAEMGCEGATMSGIAERAGACIGSLYQFFPNKESITAALRGSYLQELRILWSSLEHTRPLSANELISRLVKETIAFLDDRPAMLHLLNSQCHAPDISIRDVLRGRLIRILIATVPHLSKDKASLLAAVLLQIMKSMNELYAETPKSQRKPLVREFEHVLSGYLESRVQHINESRKAGNN